MLIGEVVKNCGLTKDGIRYYESMGLIHSEPLVAGTRIYRDYKDDTLIRLALIEHGKSLGFSLKEGKPILDAILNGTFTAEEQIKVGEKKISELQGKIEELKCKIQKLEETRELLLQDPSRDVYAEYLKSRDFTVTTCSAEEDALKVAVG